MVHPGHEALAAARDPGVLAHVAECADCRIVFAAVHGSQQWHGVPVRLWNPASFRRSWLWTAVAACALGATVGSVMPISQPERPPIPRTFLHIDFTRTGGYILTDGAVETVELGGRQLSIASAAPIPGGWAAVSIKLTEPVRIERECLVRMRISTNAGYVVAQLFPLGRDATFLKFSLDTDSEATVTAHVRPGENFGTTLKPGDTIDWITIVAPSAGSTSMLVHAIELESLP